MTVEDRLKELDRIITQPFITERATAMIAKHLRTAIMTLDMIARDKASKDELHQLLVKKALDIILSDF